MSAQDLVVVTGAFGYSGKYITKKLLAQGTPVKTLTGHPGRPNPYGERIAVAPFNFDDPDAMAASMRGARTLVNTYWIRFPYRGMTYEKAVANTKALIRAAETAGVQRIVHISIANAAVGSPLAYFHFKGILEQAVKDSTLSHAIVRPTVIFGPEGILINNIAWLLRRFPAFGIAGSGDYRLQPVFVEDVADLVVRAALRHDNFTIDAAGPETYTFERLVRLIARVVGSRAVILHLPPGLALLSARIVGRLVNDLILTRDEVIGLMMNLLVSHDESTGRKPLSEWLRENADRVGRRYASELAAHYR